MDDFDRTLAEYPEGTKLCTDCLEEWSQCTCGDELCMICGEVEEDCNCYDDENL